MNLCAVLGAAAVLGGCATYHALPLPAHTNLAAAGTSAPPATATVPVALDLQRVGQLAVARDPVLAAARARTRIARSRAYAAGLLPDPSLSLSLAHPFNGGAPSDHHNAWSAGLTENLIGLITHGDLHSAAAARYAESLLSLRWQAEQVALKTRITYLEIWASRRAVADLQAESRVAQAALDAANHAHAAGALSAAIYQQVQQQAVTIGARLQQARDREVQLEATLATSLRAVAGQRWRLAPPPAASVPTLTTVVSDLRGLSRHRLDLLALQAGYRGANRQLRADILAQFPILDIGFTRARDNTGVNSFGFGITLRLPIFNGNRGKIAVDRATRRALKAAYQAHLDKAANNIRATYRRLRLATRTLQRLDAELPALRRSAHAARTSLAARAVTRLQAFGTLTAWLDARTDADRLRATTSELALTLGTLLAMPSPLSTAAETST